MGCGVGVGVVLLAWALLGRSMRGALRRAFRPVSVRWRRGLSLAGYAGRGALHGRTLSVRGAWAWRDRSTSSLEIELASGAGFSARFVPRSQAPAPPQALDVPGCPDYLIFSDAADKTLALARAAQGELHRVLAARAAAERRVVEVRSGVVALTVTGLVWPELTAASLARDLDELVALATKAERV